MRRFFASLFLVIILGGCAKHEDSLERGMVLRDKLLQGQCSFQALITADYGDRTGTFTLGCTSDKQGNLKFIVISPESISGISGKLTSTSGFLTFDDTILSFPLLADGELSPVSAPWLLLTALRGGYLSSSCWEGESVRLTVYDSYEQDALQLDVWLNAEGMPEYAEILWQGRRVLSIEIKDFTIM